MNRIDKRIPGFLLFATFSAACFDLCAAQSTQSLTAGNYEILICKESCSFENPTKAIVKGQLVLFAEPLAKKDLDRFDPIRFLWHLPGNDKGPINGCFTLETLRKENSTYAGLEKIGVTAWRLENGELKFALYHSVSAGYEVSLKKNIKGFSGMGASWGGAFVGDGAGLSKDVIVARRTGDADLGKCVFETPEEAETRRLLADPAREQIFVLEKSYRTSLVANLQASAKPHDWAMAGWLQNSEEGEAPILRARKAAPDDRLIQWIAVDRIHSYAVPVTMNGVAQGITFKSREVDASALAQLQRAEPGNAAPWLMALRDAVDKNDEAATDVAMTSLAASTYYDDHAAELFKAQIEVFRSHPLADDYFAAVARLDPDWHLHGAFSNDVAPYYANRYPFGRVNLGGQFPSAYDSGMHELYVVCAQQPNRTGARGKQCAAIGKMLTANARRFEFRNEGAMLLSEISVFDNADIERARADSWIAAQNNAVHADRVSDDKPYVGEDVAFIDDWIATCDELEAMRRAVVRAGKPLVPAPDWKLGPLFRNFDEAWSRRKGQSAD